MTKSLQQEHFKLPLSANIKWPSLIKEGHFLIENSHPQYCWIYICSSLTICLEILKPFCFLKLYSTNLIPVFLLIIFPISKIWFESLWGLIVKVVVKEVIAFSFAFCAVFYCWRDDFCDYYGINSRKSNESKKRFDGLISYAWIFYYDDSWIIIRIKYPQILWIFYFFCFLISISENESSFPSNAL